MKVEKFLSVLIVFVVTCDNVVKSQSCSSDDLPLGGIRNYSPQIKTLFVGSIANFTVENALNASMSPGDFAQYFSIQLDNEVLQISTSNSFRDYEFNENSIFPAIDIQFACASGSNNVVIIFSIEETNNYAPNFTQTSYNVMVPTPLPVGLDITYFMNDEGIKAKDFDLFGNSLVYEIVDSNLFRADWSVDSSGLKPEFKAKIITTQNILQIPGDEMTISIKATDTSSTNPKSSIVSLKITVDPDNSFEGQLSLQFEQSLYQGTFNESDGRLTIGDVTFSLENYNSNITFDISGSDATNFGITYFNNIVTISLKSGLQIEDMMEKAFYIFKVDAFEHGIRVASTNILINTEAAKAPKFHKNFYTATANQTHLNHEVITVDDENVDVTLSEAFFDVTLTGTNVVITLKAGAIIPVDRSTFVINLYVQHRLNNKRSESLLIVTVEVELEDKLAFSASLYEGSISKSMQLTHDSISLNNDSFTITVSGRDSQFVSTTKVGSAVNLNLMNIDQIPKNVQYLQITLTASALNFLDAEAFVILGIERENSPEIDMAQPYFPTKIYFFSTLSNQTGLIGNIRATVPDGSIPSYGLLFTDNALFGKLKIESGDLILNEFISPGIYNITALALNAQRNATAEITLNVIEKLCEGDLLTTVEKSLAVEHLAENTIHNNIMFSKINDCEYEIFRVIPNTLRSFFTIDASSHYLKNTIVFDREASEFRGQLMPQIQIIMELKCDGVSKFIEPFASDVITDEILFSTSITHLNIIIEDVNDNVPVITNPVEPNYKIGFPEKSLIARVMPQYLIKIEATDADEGINAKIKFSITSAHFDIDPESGVVYSTQELPDEIVHLTIKATDRDGAADGLSDILMLDVIKLNSDSIIQMTVNNLKIAEVQNFIDDLSTRVDLLIRSISHAPIPNDIETEAKQLNSNEGELIIYAYAFENSGEVVKAQELINKLKAVNSEIKFALIEEDVHECESAKYGGWIAAVVVLSILLLIAIALPLVYIFWFKEKV